MLTALALLAAVGAPDRWRPFTPPVEVVRVWTYDEEEQYFFTPLDWLLTRGPVVGAWPHPRHVERSWCSWSRPRWDHERRNFHVVVRYGPDLMDRGPDPFDHASHPRPDLEITERQDGVEFRTAATEPAGGTALDRLCTLVSPTLPTRPQLDGRADSLPRAAWDAANVIDVAVAASRAVTPKEREDLIRATRNHPRPAVRAYVQWLQDRLDAEERERSSAEQVTRFARE
ncbi:hypothetical protein J0H58_06460 [bacterium]|nr:hypothetical protein [bacterium]